ncbi:AAA family ATPase [Tumebacillus permanentifrigoris]|uniref:MoxR-like ATPase n=1 Tax=Tumebacillus permanentifrigoris TaxID=378543 RepID=A0A316D9Q5_9BACL|nr:MoxR family ATPase [Tumebacillus permanentifrigoris]PWK12834.1 MoxR-like ATPase [Tumebacillus permanentifrigoris]
MSTEQIAAYRARMQQVREAVAQQVIGQEEVVEGVLLCILAGGHALLEGVPGLGKTLLVRTMSDVMDLHYSRIQFTPDLMPADIVGTEILREEPGQGLKFVFQPGPIHGNLVLADEINRATPKTQSALLEAMQEASVTVGGQTRQLPMPFFVLATQNPLELEGTYPLPEAQLDRFLLKIAVPFPTRQELLDIVTMTTGHSQGQPQSVITAEEILAIQATVRQMLITPELIEHTVDLILHSQPDHDQASDDVRRYVRYGAGPRAAQAIVKVAKARAFLHGRLNVSPEDIRTVALPALRHRIGLNFEAAADNYSVEQLIEHLLGRVGL